MENIKNQGLSAAASTLLIAANKTLLLPDPTDYLLDPPEPFSYLITDLDNLVTWEGTGHVETLHVEARETA